MKRKTAKTIARIYRDIEAAEPDISTERLLEMTSQEASQVIGRWIDNADVCEAMEMVGEFKQA